MTPNRLLAFIVCRRCGVRSPEEAEDYGGGCHSWHRAHLDRHVAAGDVDAWKRLVWTKVSAGEPDLRLPVAEASKLAPQQYRLSAWTSNAEDEVELDELESFDAKLP